MTVDPRQLQALSGSGICVSCDETEHDTCLNLLRPGTCSCTCPTDANLEQPPMPATAMFVILGRHPMPGMTRPGQRPVPPWPSGFYCGQHHLIEGDNAYYDRHLRRWLCRTCRRASWRRSKQRSPRRAAS